MLWGKIPQGKIWGVLWGKEREGGRKGPLKKRGKIHRKIPQRNLSRTGTIGRELIISWDKENFHKNIEK